MFAISALLKDTPPYTGLDKAFPPQPELTLEERYELACWEFDAAKAHKEELERDMANAYAAAECADGPSCSD